MTAGMYLAVNTAVKKIGLSRHNRQMSALPYQTALVMVKELHAYLRHGPSLATTNTYMLHAD
jgi:hypothetical protein